MKRFKVLLAIGLNIRIFVKLFSPMWENCVCRVEKEGVLSKE